MRQETGYIPEEIILSKIYFIRGQKIMLDRDLATLYETDTRSLKQAVRRNQDIFPKNFMFELTEKESQLLVSQNVIPNKKRGGSRYCPMAFTEHGVLQLANVLRSKRARSMSISIIEVFIKMREMILTNKELILEMQDFRNRLTEHDEKIDQVFDYITQFLTKDQTETQRRKIGFKRAE